MGRKIADPNPWSDADVARHWDEVAERYVAENDRVRHAHAQRFERALEWLELRPGLRVLNVTSRDGEAEEWLRRECEGLEIVHAEISRGLMKVAERLRPGLDQRPIETYSRLPFAEGEFDRVLSLETIEHAAEPLRFLEELHRVARAGARLVASHPPATAELPYRVWTRLFGGHGEGPHRFLSSREARALLEAAGWTVLHHEGTLLVPVGPRPLRRAGEWLIRRLQRTPLSELGIRQFHVARKA